MSSRGKPGMRPQDDALYFRLLPVHPAKDSEAVCNKLHEDNIFCVPLAAGVRVGLCCTPLSKIYGMAKKSRKPWMPLVNKVVKGVLREAAPLFP